MVCPPVLPQVAAKRPLRRLVVVSFGSRGDIQPFVALSLGLQKRGYNVHVLTNEDHVRFVHDFGLECSAAGLAMQRFLKESPAARKAMAEGDFLACLKAMQEPAYVESVVAVYKPAFIALVKELQPDLAIMGTLTDWHQCYCSLVLRVPVMRAALQWAMASPGRTPWGLPHLPFGLNKIVVDKVLYAGAYEAEAELEKKAVAMHGIPPTFEHFFDVKTWTRTFLHDLNFEVLVAQTPQVADVLYDKETRPSRLNFTGPWVLNGAAQLEAVGRCEAFGGVEGLKAVEDFIAKGAKPVYMGWGSMTCQSPEYMCRLAVGALQAAGARGVVLGGFADLRLELLDGDLRTYAEEKVVFAKKLPHAWLFPQCACLVHHGGAGTTNAALAAGVPQVITPVFLDQYDHAFLVRELGVGVGMKQLQKLKARDLGEALKKVLGCADFERKAREVARGEQESPGVEMATERVEAFWKEEVLTGRFFAVQDQETRAFQARKREVCCFGCAR